MPAASQAARDLLWVVNTPSFVQGQDVAPTPSPLVLADIDQDHLNGVVRDAGPLHRVGRYFELLLGYWYHSVRQVEVVATGLQIKDGKRTIGEIDYLYRDEHGVLVHCEASVKFFLHLEGATPSAFPGPNAMDNYEHKTSKLFDKQLRLSETHAPEVERREAFVKGMMFYRDDATGSRVLPDRMPARLPDNHLRGRWIYENEIDTLADGAGPDAEPVFAVAEKPNWLAPVDAVACVSRRSFAAQMQRHFASRGYPLMVSVRNADNPDLETARLFVVSDDWPAPHSAR